MSDHWAGMDRTISHMVHAAAGLAGNKVVFKGGSHLRFCIAATQDLPSFRYSEDLDFEWSGNEWRFWEMLAEAVRIASRTSNHKMVWAERGDQFRWMSPSDGAEGHIKIDYRQRGHGRVDWYQIWNPYNDQTLAPAAILGVTPDTLPFDKISTLASYGRAKARDLYDLWFLSEFGYVNLADIWTDWYCEHGVALQALADEVVEVQWDYYLKDWYRGVRKSLFPNQDGNWFEGIALEVFDRLEKQ